MCSTWPRPSLSGQVPLDEFDDSWDDQAIIQALTAVKGIGVWTAEMFLIFVLNRPDVLPAGDLGVRVGTARPPRAGRAARAARLPRPGRALAAVSHHRELVYLEGRRHARTLTTVAESANAAVPAPQAAGR